MRCALATEFRLRSKGLHAKLSVGAVAATLVVSLLPANAMAECTSNSQCVEETGDYSTRVEGNQVVQGGDGVGGSQVIDGEDVDGSFRVDADNDSDYSDASGGDAPTGVKRSNSSTTVMSGQSTSDSVVVGSNTQVTSGSGSFGPDQTGEPDEASSSQAPATGASVFSGTATTSEPDVNAERPRDTSSIAAPARAFPTIVQDGDRRLVLRSEGSAASGDAVSGGQVVAVVAMTGETTITATNRSVFSTAQSGTAKGKLERQAVEGDREVQRTVISDDDNGELDLASPSSIETSSGGAGIAQTATLLAPAEMKSDDEVTSQSDSGAAQSASLDDSEDVMALSGEQTMSRSVVYEADGVDEQETIVGVAGGDAIAGGQVIGVAAIGGDVTVNASNQSFDATALGGDVALEVQTRTGAAPRITLTENPTEGSADFNGTPPDPFGSQTATGAIQSNSNEASTSVGSGPATGSATMQQTASTGSAPAS